MVRLQDRKIAILGGSFGIGLETAPELTRRGARVMVGGRDDGHLAEAREAIGNGVATIATDATQPDSLRSFAPLLLASTSSIVDTRCPLSSN